MMMMMKMMMLTMMMYLKQNQAQSTLAELTHKGVN